MLTAWATPRTLPSVAAIYLCLAPFLSSLSGAVFLGEQLGVFDFIGAAFIICGTAIVVGLNARDSLAHDKEKQRSETQTEMQTETKAQTQNGYTLAASESDVGSDRPEAVLLTSLNADSAADHLQKISSGDVLIASAAQSDDSAQVSLLASVNAPLDADADRELLPASERRRAH